MARPSIPSARERLLDDVVDRLAAATLDDLLSFLTVSTAATAAGMTKGGITYHYPTRDDLIPDIIAHALARYEEWSYGDLIETVNDLASGAGSDRDVASAIARQVGHFSPGEDFPPTSSYWRVARPVSMVEILHAVAAPNDHAAQERMAGFARRARSTYAALIEQLLTASGRKWRSSSTERFGVLTQALTEGFVYLGRFDSRVAPMSLFSAAWLELFAAFTYDPSDDLTDREIATLLARMDRSAPVITVERVSDAAWEVYRDRGLNSLRHDSVAKAGRFRSESLLRAAPKRRDLQEAAFRGGIAAATQRSGSDCLDVPSRLPEYLTSVTDLAYNHPTLARAYQAGTSTAWPTPGTPYDPPGYVAVLLGRSVTDARSSAAIAALLSLSRSDERLPSSTAVGIALSVLGEVERATTTPDPPT